MSKLYIKQTINTCRNYQTHNGSLILHLKNDNIIDVLCFYMYV